VDRRLGLAQDLEDGLRVRRDAPREVHPLDDLDHLLVGATRPVSLRVSVVVVMAVTVFVVVAVFMTIPVVLGWVTSVVLALVAVKIGCLSVVVAFVGEVVVAVFGVGRVVVAAAAAGVVVMVSFGADLVVAVLGVRGVLVGPGVVVVTIATAVLAGQHHVDGGRADTVLGDATDLVGHVEGAGVRDGREGVPVGPGGEQGREQHVAAGPHPPVERECSHTGPWVGTGKKGTVRWQEVRSVPATVCP